MAIGEVFLGAFITVLFEKLASPDLIKLARSAGIHSELNKLRNKLALIRAVLADAGQKHITDTSVQLWLNHLQHLAYEIDDVLDDLATEAAMRRQLKKESYASTSTSKISKFIPTKYEYGRKLSSTLDGITNKLHALKYGHKMSSKLDGITAKLRHLVEEKNLLGLNDNAKSSEVFSRRLKETSLVDESKIIGREGDKEALLGRLLSSESSSSQTANVNVVSIVGLGGIGKTTLAKLLYNDEKVKEHFELKVWVCISDEFDVLNITKVICQVVGGGNQDSTDLNLLQESLKQKLSNKRFLIVLDDVWNERYSDWELLQRPFTKGAPGSKVLVTTRKTMVASVMDSIQMYPLELLSDEEALSLFGQHASGEQNFNVNQTLKLHGEDIIKKCGRLPLALRTLGRVFRTKSSIEEWEQLLSDEIWNLDNRGEILPALRLSYYDLPPHLKQIFVYCSLFPKDYMFNKNELVLLWMAEGFLGQPKGDKSMESFGGECFEELVSRSFFQQSTNNKLGYSMHDLINDLAMSVAGEFYFMLDDKMDICNRHEALEKVHHFSFIRDHNEAYEKFKALQRARRLRTFLAMSVEWLYIWHANFRISNEVLTELLPQMQFLRALSLANHNISEVPKSIGRLKHMRYLNFSNTKITCLPEQVGELHNLQSLLLSSCHELSSLPNNIGKLINLRHLDIDDTPKLTKMPLGLGGLTGLQTLPKVVIGGAGECRISDLKALLHLRGQLSIEGLHNVKDEMHAKEADLQQKKGICDLTMEWSDVIDDSRDEQTEYAVLEVLRPSEKLASLEIVYYGGLKLPSWVGLPSFGCLTQLELRRCLRCKCLPTLGHLPSLQELIVESMDGLKTVGLELLGLSNSWNGVAFPSLKVLKFKDMKSLEEWSTSGGDIAGAFPCLRQMSITNCPKLESYNGPNCIEKFEIKECASLVSVRCWKEEHFKMGIKSAATEVTIVNCEKLESYYCSNYIKKLYIHGCPLLTSLPFPTMDNLQSTLKSLTIRGCDNMDETWLLNNNNNIESIPDNGYAFLPFLCLRYLEIWNCKNLKSFPHELLQNLTSLKEMKIYFCPSLDFPFPRGSWPPNLSSLTIGVLKKPVSEWGLQKFPTSLVTLILYGEDSDRSVSLFAAAKGGEEEDISSSFILPSSLTQLTIWRFKELESVSEGLQHLTCLQHLEIWKCPKVRDLPETLLPSLSTLALYDCSEELKEKCSESRKGKYWPLISKIPDFEPRQLKK